MHESHEPPPLESGRGSATPRTGIEEDAPTSRISALIRLLGDESQDICAVAWKNLEKIWDHAGNELRFKEYVRSETRSFLRAARD